MFQRRILVLRSLFRILAVELGVLQDRKYKDKIWTWQRRVSTWVALIKHTCEEAHRLALQLDTHLSLNSRVVDSFKG
jgi:hypothetical protein